MELKSQIEAHAKYVKERNAYSRKNDSWDFMQEMQKKWKVWKEYLIQHNASTDMLFDAYNKSVTLPAEGAFYLLFDKIDRATREKLEAERMRDYYKQRYEAVLASLGKDIAA